MPNRHRLLIVEDDPVTGPALVREFSKEGMACVLATTLKKALEESSEAHFACVVLDAGLPDEEIQTEFDTINRIPEFKTRVVLYTASGNRRLFRAARKFGASIIEKNPGSIDSLVAAVWNEINFEEGDDESEVKQQQAQRKVQEAVAIQESTMVSISLGRVFAIVGALVIGTYTITSFVIGKVTAKSDEIKADIALSIAAVKAELSTNTAGIKTDLAANTEATNKRMTSFEEALKRDEEATSKRILEWTKWRWGVSQDIRNLGEATKTKVVTPQE